MAKTPERPAEGGSYTKKSGKLTRTAFTEHPDQAAQQAAERAAAATPPAAEPKTEEN